MLTRIFMGAAALSLLLFLGCTAAVPAQTTTQTQQETKKETKATINIKAPETTVEVKEEEPAY